MRAHRSGRERCGPASIRRPKAGTGPTDVRRRDPPGDRGRGRAGRGRGRHGEPARDPGDRTRARRPVHGPAPQDGPARPHDPSSRRGPGERRGRCRPTGRRGRSGARGERTEHAECEQSACQRRRCTAAVSTGHRRTSPCTRPALRSGRRGHEARDVTSGGRVRSMGSPRRTGTTSPRSATAPRLPRERTGDFPGGGSGPGLRALRGLVSSARAPVLTRDRLG